MTTSIVGCDGDRADGSAVTAPREVEGVATMGGWDQSLTTEDLERGRLSADWRRVVQLDTLSAPADSSPNPETWEQISTATVNEGPMHLPLYGDVAGASVLRGQILLDRVLFSPGIIDGKWGKNTEKAVYWFQQREGLRRTGVIDQQTFERLVQLAGGGTDLIRTHTLSEEDVAGPFVEIPDDIYDKAEMECMCYESLSEKLAEQFHTSPELLVQLNPQVDFTALSAGSTIEVPSVRDPNAGQNAQVARIVVSGEGYFVHAMDAGDRILFHFPTTLGSSYDPSPTGEHRVAGITTDPWWHYQPSILESVPDEEEEARIPPGPNNAVGVVWMALSIPHYGIHGTSAPETIGYTTSAGCIRLTNWDAAFLSQRIDEGVPVHFTEGGAPSET